MRKSTVLCNVGLSSTTRLLKIVDVRVGNRHWVLWRYFNSVDFCGWNFSVLERLSGNKGMSLVEPILSRVVRGRTEEYWEYSAGADWTSRLKAAEAGSVIYFR